MAVAADDDPLVALGRETLSPASFRALMAAAVERNPGVGEGAANAAEALAARREAKSARFPTVDLGFTSNRSLARDYSNDPDNVVERSRGEVAFSVAKSDAWQFHNWDEPVTPAQIKGLTPEPVVADGAEKSAQMLFYAHREAPAQGRAPG